MNFDALLKPFFGKRCAFREPAALGGTETTFFYAFDAAEEKKAVKRLFENYIGSWDALEERGFSRGDITLFGVVVYDDRAEPVDYDHGLKAVLDTSPQIEDVIFYDRKNTRAYSFNFAALEGRDAKRAKTLDALGIRLSPPPKRKGPVTLLHSNNAMDGVGKVRKEATELPLASKTSKKRAKPRRK